MMRQFSCLKLGNYHERLDSGSGRCHCLPDFRGEISKGENVKKNGYWNLDGGKRFGEEFSIPVELKHGLPTTDINDSGNVLPTVYAVSGGPDDLAHIRPHGVEAGAGKRAAVTRAGNGNLSGLGLFPGDRDDIRRVNVVSEFLILRINRLVNQALRTALHATEASLAELVDGVAHYVR